MVQSVPAEAAVERGYSSTKLTYSDYVRFPDDGLRHEIIDGEHYVTPSPVTRHQRISRDLLHILLTYLDSQPIGEVFDAPFDVLFSNIDIVVPDLVYISKERAHLVTEKNLQGAPDLVVEILSPGTRRRDERLKRDLYERVGVDEYWLIDPERDTVSVYRRRAERFEKSRQYVKSDFITTPLLPGLSVPLERIFVRPETSTSR